MAVSDNDVFIAERSGIVGSVTGADIKAYAQAGGGGGGSVYSVAKRRSVDSTEINGNFIASWPTELIASAEITWSASNPSRFTIGADGIYHVSGHMTYLSNAARDQACAEIYVNGVSDGLLRGNNYIRNSGSSWDFGNAELGNVPFAMTAGDYFEFGLRRVAGANSTYGQGSTGAIDFRGLYSEVSVTRMA